MTKKQFALLLPFIVSLIFITSGLWKVSLPTYSPQPSPTYKLDDQDNQAEATVTSITDGDTFRAVVNGEEKVIRLIGIDTPEISKKPECFGREASAFLSQLISGQVVVLEKDVSETDRYGRLLRYVYVGDQFINEYMVSQGYANVATYPPDVKYQQKFSLAEQDARAGGRGLWSVCK